MSPKAWLEMGAAVAIALAIAFGVHWIYRSGVDAGTDKERAAWQKRELAQQQSYDAKITELRKSKDAELGQLQARLAQADQDYQAKREEADRAKAKNARFDRGLRDGSIVLVDPGHPGAGEAGSGPGAAGAATACRCDGAPREPGRLSAELGTFLFSEADRADEVIVELEDQLHLAQDVVTAYYRIALACQQAGAP